MPDTSFEIGSMVPGHYGAPGSRTVLTPATIVAAWGVQGDSTRDSLMAEVERCFSVAFPVIPNSALHHGALHIFWSGPRSWLVVESTPSGNPAALIDFDTKRDAINRVGGAVFDLSASWVAYTLSGPGVPVVLARCCPLDFDARAFSPGCCAQSVLGRIAALFYRHVHSRAFTVMVARSFSADAWHGICVAAETDGYDVTPPTKFDGARAKSVRP